jgi:hypothetical protein
MSLARIATMIAVGLVVGLPATAPVQAEALSPNEAKAIAAEAYLYAYPRRSIRRSPAVLARRFLGTNSDRQDLPTMMCIHHSSFAFLT